MAQQPSQVVRLAAQRGPFCRHHVRVEVGWTPDGLAGVVDDEVEALARGDEVAAERLHGGRVAQVETEDFEPVTPVAEVGLLRVARRGVPREPCRDDEVRAGAEELQAGLVADLDAPAGEQRDTAAQVRELRARGEIDIGARGAELIVEVVDARVGLLADIADAGGGAAFVVRRSRVVVWRRRLVVGVVRLEALRRKHVGGGDGRPPAQRPDSRLVEHRFSPPDARRFRGFLPFPFRLWIRYPRGWRSPDGSAADPRPGADRAAASRQRSAAVTRWRREAVRGRQRTL